MAGKRGARDVSYGVLIARLIWVSCLRRGRSRGLGLSLVGSHMSLRPRRHGVPWIQGDAHCERAFWGKESDGVEGGAEGDLCKGIRIRSLT